MNQLYLNKFEINLNFIKFKSFDFIPLLKLNLI